MIDSDEIEAIGQQTEAEQIAAMAQRSPLRLLHDTQVSAQKLRIGLSNRLTALERAVDDHLAPEVLRDCLAIADQLEHRIDRGIAAELHNYPVWDSWLSHVKGIGPSLAGQMLALLLPPGPQWGPSSWWKAAGLVPAERPDGLMRLPKPRAGEGKITYHPWLRRCLYNVGTSFVRNGGYYRAVYEEAKARLQEQHRDAEEWPPIRLDRSARWIMVKRFLADLWGAWCEAEGIHNRGPYGLTTLPDGTQVIRIFQPDGAWQDHAYVPFPRWGGNGKI